MAKFARGSGITDFSSVKTQNNDLPRVDDLLELVKLTPRKGIVVRLIGGMFAYPSHTVEITKKAGGMVNVPFTCLAWNHEAQEHTREIRCPYCEMTGATAPRKYYYINVIVRSLQEDKPERVKLPSKEEKATGLIKKGSQTWTACNVLRLTPSMIQRIQELCEKNKVKNKAGQVKSFSIGDERYGRDIEITFDDKKTPALMYTIDFAESPSGGKFSPLSDEENSYLQWDVSDIYYPKSEEEADNDVKRWGATPSKVKPKAGKNEEDDEDEDTDDDLPEDEDVDDIDDEDSLDEDEDADDEDDEDSEDDEEDDEDEEDNLDEDDEEDEPPPPPKKKPKKPVVPEKSKGKPVAKPTAPVKAKSKLGKTGKNPPADDLDDDIPF